MVKGEDRKLGKGMMLIPLDALRIFRGGGGSGCGDFSGDFQAVGSVSAALDRKMGRRYRKSAFRSV